MPWDADIVNSPHAGERDPGGLWIRCATCEKFYGKEEKLNFGELRLFSNYRWKEHIGSKRHTIAEIGLKRRQQREEKGGTINSYFLPKKSFSFATKLKERR